MKNFTRLLVLVILATGWQGLLAQTTISTQSFGTTPYTSAQLAGGSLTGWTLLSGYTNNQLYIGESGTNTSSGYTIGTTSASGSEGLVEASSVIGLSVAQCTGQFSTNGAYSGYTNIQVGFGYRYSSAFSGEVKLLYRVGSSGGFTQLFADTIASGVAVAPMVSTGWAALSSLYSLAGATNAAEIDFQISVRSALTKGNFEIDDLTLVGQAPTPSITVGASALSINTQLPSNLQEVSYTISGVNLSTPIIITPPAGVMLGHSSGGELAAGDTIEIQEYSGVASATVYAELATSNPTGAFASANITNASTGATTKNVAVSGTVYPAAVAFTANNLLVEQVLSGGISVLNEYTPAGSLVQTIPLFTGATSFYAGTSSSEGVDGISVDGQYAVATGYSTSAIDNAAPSASAPRIFARIKYDGSIDLSTQLTDATTTAGNMRNAASIDGSGFWLSGNNKPNNPDIYQSFGAVGGESYFQGTSVTEVAPLTNTRGIGIFDGSIYASVGSEIYQIPGTPTSNGTLATPLNGTPGAPGNYGGEGAKGLAFMMFDVDPSNPGPDVLYIADLGTTFTANTAYSSNTAGSFGLFKYIDSSGTWAYRGKVVGPASAVTGKVVGNNIVLYAIVNNTSLQDTLYTITDLGAGNASTYKSSITNNGKSFGEISGSYIATSPVGAQSDFEGVTFTPQPLAASSYTVTNTTGASVSNNMEYGSGPNILYQFTMVNNSSVTPAYLTAATFTPSGTYIPANLTSFTLYYNPLNSTFSEAYVIGSVTPTASGTSFTFNTGIALPPSATGYFYVCATIASSGNGNTVIINAPVDANFTFTDGGSAVSGTYTGGGTNTIIPAQQVASTSTSVVGLYTTVGSASPWEEFKVSGTDLIANETVTFTTGTYFEMSTDSATWVSGATSISLTPSSGIVSPTRILVRIQASAPAGSYTDALTIASTDAISITVSVSGTVGKPFTAGNIVCSRAVGLTSAASQVYIDEYTTSGTLVQSIPLPTAAVNGNYICTMSGSAGTVGLDHLSLDGQYYLSGGYNAALGTASITSQSNSSNGGTRDEVIARVKYDGTINTTTRITNAYDANLIRSVASIDGTSFWVSGRSNDASGTLPQAADGGVTYVPLGGSSATFITPGNQVGTSNINIIASQLYVSNYYDTSPNIPAPYGVNAIGIGVNSTGNQSLTSLIASLANTQGLKPWGYVAFTTDTTVAGVDVIYIADQDSGLYKFAQYPQGTWSQEGRLTGSANGITGKIVGTNIVLYFIEGARGARNYLYTLTDPVGHAVLAGDQTPITTAATQLAECTANGTFSSVDFAPVTLSGTPSLAISSTLPVAGGILPGSVQDVLYNLTATASIAPVIVTSIQVTTAGTYVPADFNSGSLNLWYSLSNNFDTTAINIGNANVPTTGGSVTFGIAAQIAVGKTGHFFVTADVAPLGASTPGHTISIASMTSSNITLADLGIVTGTAAAGGVQTIDNCNGSGGVAYAGGGTTANTNTVICSGTSASMGLHNYLATSIQWQQSADGETSWTNVTGGTGGTTATYVTAPLTATTYFRALVVNSCFTVASNTVIVYVSAAPTVALTNVSPTSVSASWTPFAVNSNVKYSLSCTGASSEVINPAGSPQAITVTPGAALNVTVTQVNPAGCAVSGNASINTELAAPTLTLGTATADGFTASWTPVTGAASYTLTYKFSANTTTWKTVTTSNTSVVLTGLYHGATYLCTVVANASGYTGAASSEELITTLPSSNSCTTPTFSVTSNCSNEINVTMSGSPSSLYRITFTRVSPNPSAGASYNVSGSSVTVVVGAQFASSVWQVLLASNCSGVFSVVAQPQYVVIKPACPQLQNLVLSTPNCDGFEATWNASTCISPADYYIFIKRQGATGYDGYSVGANPYVYAGWLGANTYNAYVTEAACGTTVAAPSTVQTITTGVGCRTEEVQADNTPANIDVEQGDAAMNIYPNPTNGNFMVNVYTKNKPDEMVQIEMVNTLGQVVYTVIAPVTNGISNNAFQVPDNVASGMYIIRTVAGGENLTQELMYTK